MDPVADIYAAEAFSSRAGARDPSRPWPATRRQRASAVRLTGSLRGPPSAKISMSSRGGPTWPTSKTPPTATTRRPTAAPARTPAPKPAGPSADPTAAASSVRSASAETAGTSAKGTPGGSRSTSTAGRTRCRPPRTRLPRRPAPCWSAPWVSRRPQPATLWARESTWTWHMQLHSPTAAMRFIPFVVYKLKWRSSHRSRSSGQSGPPSTQTAAGNRGSRFTNWVCGPIRRSVSSLSMPRPAPRLPQTRPSGWSSTLRIRLLRTSSEQPSPPARGRTPAPSGIGR